MRSLEEIKERSNTAHLMIAKFGADGEKTVCYQAMEDIPHLITTIESQQEKLTKYSNLFLSLEASFLKFLSLTNINIATHPSVELQADAVNLLLESQKEEIDRLTLQIKRAHLSLTWCNTEQQIPSAVHHLEQVLPKELRHDYTP